MDALCKGVEEVSSDPPGFDLEILFHAEYPRVVRTIARVTRDRPRAEELAVEVFLRIAKHPNAQRSNARGWLYRTAVRLSLDELRRAARRTRFQSLLHAGERASTPEDVRAANEEQGQVRAVLAALSRRQAEMLVLRNQGFSYSELAATLQLNPASVGNSS